ncbi:MAG: patatin-like phospholipase family protein [Paludibacteraceae bacterium]|nr:patatin-like phospholipase family protein [Paludibacteraceae bacterium]
MAKYKFGLALSGGGIRGVAHIGVLMALRQIGLEPDIISGVSAGAIVGAMYADGLSFDKMLGVFRHSSFQKSVKFNMPKNGGLSNVKGYKNYLAKTLQTRKFSDLKIPLVVNATDLNEGTITYFRDGNLLDAVVASASVPVLFNPYKIGAHYYVDGGILCNLPAEVLREECELVIGVHVNPILPMPVSSKYGIKTVSERVFHLAVNGNTVRQKEFCDLVIDMEREDEVGMFEASKSESLMKMGYDTAIDAFKNFDFSKFGLKVNIF